MATEYYSDWPRGTWTKFYDLHSGGGQKLDYSEFYIEADEPTARAIFEERFGRDPDNVTCSCCGSDYSVYECEPPSTDTEARPDVLVIRREARDA